MNQVALVGHVTKDPVLRRLSEGRVQTSFVIAVNRAFKNKNGEVDADFILCSTWGRVAENFVKHCGKGSLIGVSGRIQSRTYEREDKTRVYITEVIGEDIRFLVTKRNSQEDGYNDAAVTAQHANKDEQTEERNDVSAHFHLPVHEKDGLPIF